MVKACEAEPPATPKASNVGGLPARGSGEGLRKRVRKCGASPPNTLRNLPAQVEGGPETGVLVENEFEMGPVALRAWGRPGGVATLGR